MEKPCLMLTGWRSEQEADCFPNPSSAPCLTTESSLQSLNPLFLLTQASPIEGESPRASLVVRMGGSILSHLEMAGHLSNSRPRLVGKTGRHGQEGRSLLKAGLWGVPWDSCMIWESTNRDVSKEV